MRRRLGTVALAALLIGGCGGRNDTVDFSNAASATCDWARQSVDVLPHRTSELLKNAAEHLRGLDVPEAQRAGAGTLVAQFGDLSRSADELSSELDARNPDPARTRRLRAAVRDDQLKIAATARTLGVSGCDAMTAVLLRDPAVANHGEATAGVPKRLAASAPKRLSRATYRTRLRNGLGDLSQRTGQVQATMRSGEGSASTLTSYAAVIGTAVNRLQPLRPPASIAPAHRDLVAGLRALRTATTRAARDLRTGGPQRATKALERFATSQAFKDLTAATATLSQAGYLPS
jgi:hypothetical protein